MRHVKSIRWTEAVQNGVCITYTDGTRRIRHASQSRIDRLNRAHSEVAFRLPGPILATNSVLSRALFRLTTEGDRFSWPQ